MRQTLLVGVVVLIACLGFAAMPAAGYNGAQNDTMDDWDWEWWGFAGLGIFFCFIPLAIFIIGIAIAVWVYRDAERRGESGALWLIINILAPIIGLIIWLIVRPDAGEKKRKEPGGRYCPECGRGIPPDAQVCPYCGATLK